MESDFFIQNTVFSIKLTNDNALNCWCEIIPSYLKKKKKKRLYQSDTAILAQPIVFAWGGATCVFSQWQTGGVFQKPDWKGSLL